MHVRKNLHHFITKSWPKDDLSLRKPLGYETPPYLKNIALPKPKGYLLPKQQEVIIQYKKWFILCNLEDSKNVLMRSGCWFTAFFFLQNVINFIPSDTTNRQLLTYPIRIIHRELLLLNSLELVPYIELCGFLLKLGKLVLILGHLLERGFYALREGWKIVIKT